MATLDDAPMATLASVSMSTPAEPEPEWGERVHQLLTDAAASRLVRTQNLGTKARGALDALARALKVEQEIEAHAAAIARLRKGEKS